MSNHVQDILLQSIPEDEFNSLYVAIYNENKRRASIRLQNLPPLNNDEKALVLKGCLILAIKAYRERTNANLLDAKIVVERFRDSDTLPETVIG